MAGIVGTGLIGKFNSITYKQRWARAMKVSLYLKRWFFSESKGLVVIGTCNFIGALIS